MISYFPTFVNTFFAASVTLDPKRDGVASLRYALIAPDCLASRGAAVIAWFALS